MSSLGFAGIEWIDADATRNMVNSGRYLGTMWEPRLLRIPAGRRRIPRTHTRPGPRQALIRSSLRPPTAL